MKDPLCLQAALEYLALGWSVIPLCWPGHKEGCAKGHACPPAARGKVPLIKWGKYQKERPTQEQVIEWWGLWPRANVGVVMGNISGMIGWDVDGPEGRDLLGKLLPNGWPTTLTFQTGGGGARYLFRWPGVETPPPRHVRTEGKALTFLGEGSQSVFPPSIHRSKGAYFWAHGHGPGDAPLATAPPDMLDAIARLCPKRRVVSAPLGAPAPQVLALLDEQQMARARGYARGFEPAIQGQGGWFRAFALACKLIHGFGLAPRTALYVMAEEWNGRCVPPWDLDELWRRVEDAARDGQADVMPDVQADEPSIIQAAHQALAATNGVVDVDGTCPPPAEEGGARRGVLASAIKPTKLHWLVEPWIAKGCLTLIAGEPASGKSTFGAYLMRRARRTVMLPGVEEDLPLMTIPRLDAGGVDLSTVLLVVDDGWAFPAAQRRLLEMAEDWKPDLIWIDPIDNYLGDLSDNEGISVRSVLESLATVARTTGASVVATRHPGKALGNVLPGSRQWRAVPRRVLEMLVDAGPPERRYIRAVKDSLGFLPTPSEYGLERHGDEPPVFRFRGSVHKCVLDTLASTPDQLERAQIEEAIRWLRDYLGEGEQESRTIYLDAEKERFHHRMLRRASERLNVDKRWEGKAQNLRCFWRLPRK